MKKRKIIKKLEDKGITTVAELLDALELSVKTSQLNIDKLGRDIKKLNEEIAFKQKRLEMNIYKKEKSVETIKIFTGK